MPIEKNIQFSDLIYRVTYNREMWLWENQYHSVDDHPSLILRNGKEICWHKHGMRHRENGPAWIQHGPNGTSYYYYNLDDLHRNNGPAWITPTEQKWYHLSRLHRADGPAVISKTGHIEWWWRGYKYDNFETWCNHSRIGGEQKVMLKLEFG